MLQVFLEAQSLAPVKRVDFLAVAMVGFSWMDYLMIFYMVICVVRDTSHAIMVIIKSLKTCYQHTPAGASTTSTQSTATMTATPVARAMGASQNPADGIQFVYQLTAAHKASLILHFGFVCKCGGPKDDEKNNLEE